MTENEREGNLQHTHHPGLPQREHLVHGRQGRKDPLCHLCPARGGKTSRNHRMDGQRACRQDDAATRKPEGEIHHCQWKDPGIPAPESE